MRKNPLKSAGCPPGRGGVRLRYARCVARRFALWMVVMSGLIGLVSGCSWAGSNVSNYEDTEDISIPAGTYHRVVVENHTGTIRVRATDGERVRGLLRKKASGNGASTLKAVVGAVTYQTLVEGDSLRIKEVYKTDDRINFWERKESTHPNVNVGLEYELLLPPGITAIEIYQSAGNTELTGYAGTVWIVNNAGNITMNGMRLAGDSRIALVSGNLDIHLAEVRADTSLVAELTAGNVTLRLPKSADVALAIGVEAGTISGNLDALPMTNSSITQTLGTGAAQCSIHVTSGNIAVKAD